MTNQQDTYITIDETHRIEIAPSGNHYPQRLTNPHLGKNGWGYYKTGNQQRHFKTERGARTFLMQQADSFSPEQQLTWCKAHGAMVQFHSSREVSINILAIRWTIWGESLEATIQKAEKALREGAAPFSL